MSSRSAGAGFVFVTLLLDIVGIGILIPVMPVLVGEMVGGDQSAAARVFGPLVALFAVTQTLFSPLLGALSDRFGRRPVLLLSLAGMALSYVVMALAPSLPWLFFGRGLAGVTSATVTATNAYMADISTPETRARNFGLVGAAFGAGFVLGPALGGVLGELSPRAPFVASAIAAALGCAWGLFVLPESLPPERRRPFGWRELDPFAGVRIVWQDRRISGLAGVFVVQSLAQRGAETVWVLYTGWRFGWSELQNGLALAAVGVAAVVVQAGLVRRIVPALGEPLALRLGLTAMALAMLAYGLVPYGWMVLLVIPIGALGGIATPALQGMVTSRVEPSRQGTVQGALAALQSLTLIVAPLVSNGLFARATDGTFGVVVPGLPFYLSSALLVLALIGAQLTARPLDGPATDG